MRRLRAIWIAVVSTSVVVLLVVSWFAWENMHHCHVQIVTDFTRYPIWNYPFPAVTVCSFNKISKSKFYKAVRSMKKPVSMSDEEFAQYLPYLKELFAIDSPYVSHWDVSRLQDIMEHNNILAHDLLRDISPNCTEIMVRCIWKGEEKKCSMIFQQIATPFGFCCSFNYFGLKNYLSPQALRQRVATTPERITECGYTTALEVVIDNNVNDYFATDINSYGHKILIHHAFDYPDWSVMKMLLGMKMLMFINVTPVLLICDKKASLLDADQRNCLFFNERKLHNFPHYTYNNCMTECRINLILTHCGCIPFYYYNPNGTLKEHRICNLRDTSCIRKFKRTVLNSELGTESRSTNASYNNCNCLPNCEFCYYPFEGSSGTLSQKHSSNGRALYQNVDAANQSSFRVFYSDLVFQRNNKIRCLYWHDIFANLGGLLSLFTGYSFGCAFELIYYFLLSPFLDKAGGPRFANLKKKNRVQQNNRAT